METAVTETKGKNGRVEAVPPALAMVIGLPIADIDESPTNPRKTFTGLEDLATDFKLRGVLQPVLARPHPKKVGRHELVFGARRFRAAKLAGIAELPVMVRQLNDAEVLEIQIVENSQREDIHPLEEADGYRMLREKHGYTSEEIAAKCGKSLTTINARLKFCTLVLPAREAFLSGKISTGVALILARIPHADQQTAALKEMLTSRYGHKDPPTVREALHIVEGRYMLRLVDATFDRNDAELVAGVPSCAVCPKRTGNQRELFSDIDAKDDLCTDVKCFKGKTDATWAAKKAAAAEAGAKVLSDKEGKKLFPFPGASLQSSAFVDLASTTYDAKGKQRTHRSMMGKAAAVPVVLVRDGEGAIHELVAKEDFKAAAKAAGNAPAPALATSSAYGSPKEIAAAKKRRAAETKKREALAAELVELVAAAEAYSPNERFWRTLASSLVGIVWSDTRNAVCRRRTLELGSKSDSEKVLRTLVEGMGGDEARGLVVELVVTSVRGDAGDNFKTFRELVAGGKAAKAPTAKPKKKSKASSSRKR